MSKTVHDLIGEIIHPVPAPAAPRPAAPADAPRETVYELIGQILVGPKPRTPAPVLEAVA